jgi:hypothetical protein
MSSTDTQPERSPVRARIRIRPITPPKAPRVTHDEDEHDEGQQEAEARPPYAVGYKKPPVHSRWQKGQSGNPRGPKKRVKSLNTIVREVMNAPVKIRTGGREQVMSRAQALVLKTVEAASKGNDRALDKLLRLFAVAMPDDGGGLPLEQTSQPDSATDEATLTALRDMIAAELDGEDSQ